MRRPTELHLSRPARQRGVGLIDAMIAMAILSFGMLAMTRLQARLVAQGTESQNRTVAAQVGDELLNMAIVDPDNAACYTHSPVASTCPSTNPARARTADWATRAAAGLPGFVSASSVLNAGQLTVTLTWAGKAVQEGATPDDHQLVMTTDVRP